MGQLGVIEEWRPRTFKRERKTETYVWAVHVDAKIRYPLTGLCPPPTESPNSTEANAQKGEFLLLYVIARVVRLVMMFCHVYFFQYSPKKFLMENAFLSRTITERSLCFLPHHLSALESARLLPAPGHLHALLLPWLLFLALLFVATQLLLVLRCSLPIRWSLVWSPLSPPWATTALVTAVAAGVISPAPLLAGGGREAHPASWLSSSQRDGFTSSCELRLATHVSLPRLGYLSFPVDPQFDLGQAWANCRLLGHRNFALCFCSAIIYRVIQVGSVCYTVQASLFLLIPNIWHILRVKYSFKVMSLCP